MKRIIFKLLAISLLSTLLFSCKEEEIVPSNEEYLMSKTWRIESLKLESEADGISVDVFKLMAKNLGAEPVIEIDFDTNSVYRITDVNNLLSVGGIGNQASGNWELEGADKKTLVLDKGTETETKLTIQTLSSTDFVSKTTVKLDTSILNNVENIEDFEIPLDLSEDTNIDLTLDFRPL